MSFEVRWSFGIFLAGNRNGNCVGNCAGANAGNNNGSDNDDGEAHGNNNGNCVGECECHYCKQSTCITNLKGSFSYKVPGLSQVFLTIAKIAHR